MPAKEFHRLRPGERGRVWSIVRGTGIAERMRRAGVAVKFVILAKFV